MWFSSLLAPRIFDPYFSTKKDGSGLGLTTAYSIVKQHRGTITAQSVPNEGTTFTMCLLATDQLLLEFLSNPDTEKDESKKAGRILFMDDEEMNRLVVSRMLRHSGFRIEVASDGVEAVHAYELAKRTDDPFDAVILDLTVPNGVGGLETIKRLMHIEPRVVAIVTSGYSTDPVMARYRDFGFSGRVEKPFKMHELENVLQTVLSGSDISH